MTKRILSVVLVLVVFLGGYSVLPKKYNVLPVNDAYCATNYGGLYYVNKKFTVEYDSTFSIKDGIPTITVKTKTYKAGTYVSVTTKGYDSTNSKINLKPYMGSKLSFVRR